MAPLCVLTLSLTSIRLIAFSLHSTAHLQRLLLPDYCEHHDYDSYSYTYININPLNFDVFPLQCCRLPHPG